jgi:hypothetical protein
MGCDAAKTKFAPRDRQKVSNVIFSLYNEFKGFKSPIFSGIKSHNA